METWSLSYPTSELVSVHGNQFWSGYQSGHMSSYQTEDQGSLLQMSIASELDLGKELCDTSQIFVSLTFYTSFDHLVLFKIKFIIIVYFNYNIIYYIIYFKYIFSFL
jgi:hypothetical protein